MGTEKYTLEDKVRFLNAFSDEVEQMFFLVDQNYKVQYYNKVFASYFKLDEADILGKDYGNAMACKHNANGNNACNLSSYCSICEIKQNLKLILTKTKDEANFDLVREFKILEEMLVKHLEFKIVPIVLNQELHALCIIKDLKETDILRMFLNPEESI
jgi:transcriptional regulator with PAS, ATPase and Fis domain